MKKPITFRMYYLYIEHKGNNFYFNMFMNLLKKNSQMNLFYLYKIIHYFLFELYVYLYK